MKPQPTLHIPMAIGTKAPQANAATDPENFRDVKECNFVRNERNIKLAYILPNDDTKSVLLILPTHTVLT